MIPGPVFSFISYGNSWKRQLTFFSMLQLCYLIGERSENEMMMTVMVMMVVRVS